MEKIKLIELLERIANKEIKNKTKIAFGAYVYTFNKETELFLEEGSGLQGSTLGRDYKLDRMLDDYVYILEEGK